MKTKKKKTWLAKAAESLDESADDWKSSAKLAEAPELKNRWNRRAYEHRKMAAACREADEA